MTAWAGVEVALVDFLTVTLAGPRVVTELPAKLTEAVPVVQVVRIGGPHDDSNPFRQIPTFSVDVFAADRPSAAALGETVDLALRRTLPGAQVHGATFGLVRTLSGFSWRPWDDLTVRRYGATFQAWIKASRTA